MQSRDTGSNFAQDTRHCVQEGDTFTDALQGSDYKAAVHHDHITWKHIPAGIYSQACS